MYIRLCVYAIISSNILSALVSLAFWISDCVCGGMLDAVVSPRIRVLDPDPRR